jgi:NADPH:quinone reductase-like Zn-dependent oxidoreductase
MKAIALVRYGKSETAFETVERPTPTIGDEEVLIEVEGFGLNFADVMARLGLYREAPPKPAILGYEVVGRIKDFGKNVTRFKKGERVVALTRFGGYAEFAVSNQMACIQIDESTPLTEAAAFATQFCTAYFIIEKKIHLKKDERILVHAAAGGVGSALVQLAKLRGAYVIATIGSNSKRDLVKSFGADEIIASREVDFAEAIEKKFGKNSIDYVCDSIGGETFKKGFKLLRPTGTIIGFGSAESTGGFSAITSGLKLLFGFGIFSPAFLIMQSRAVIGVNMLRIADLRPDLIQDCLQGVLELYRAKKIKPVSGGEYPLDQLAHAHQLLEDRKTVGKLAVRFKSI